MATAFKGFIDKTVKDYVDKATTDPADYIDAVAGADAPAAKTEDDEGDAIADIAAAASPAAHSEEVMTEIDELKKTADTAYRQNYVNNAILDKYLRMSAAAQGSTLADADKAAMKQKYDETKTEIDKLYAEGEKAVYDEEFAANSAVERDDLEWSILEEYSTFMVDDNGATSWTDHQRLVDMYNESKGKMTAEDRAYVEGVLAEMPFNELGFDGKMFNNDFSKSIDASMIFSDDRGYWVYDAESSLPTLSVTTMPSKPLVNGQTVHSAGGDVWVYYKRDGEEFGRMYPVKKVE